MIQLSNQQQAAIDHIGSPALVAAGAGSGKTRTLIAKFEQLVQSGLDPSRILAITFTNKAALEMKNRLILDIGMQKENLQWVKTYHSACLNILKKHCNITELNKPIQIYTAYHQQKIIKEILTSLNFDKTYANLVLNHISNAKNTGTPEIYFKSKCKLLRIPIAQIYRLYEKQLLSRNAVDFDNILLLTRNLLRDNLEIRKFYKNFFQYILCDEYQDTNNLNEEIMGLILNKKNFFVVGDDWQSIYSFRMSNIDHFMSFIDKYPTAKMFKLEENYRSTNKIVQLGNRLINFNKTQMKKRCYSKKKGGIIEIKEFYSDFEEANWVTKKIKTLHSIGIPYEGIAILYRTKFYSLLLEKELRKNNIPYQLLGSKGFFERMEILDLNCYLAAAVFDKDDASFERIINTPKRGIGSKTLKKIYNTRNNEISLRQIAQKIVDKKIFSKKICMSLQNLLTLLDQIKSMNPSEAIHKILNETNYINYIENITKANSIELTSRIENIKQLIYCASQKSNIIEYLEETVIVRDDKEHENDKFENSGINLSTVHKTKGLEFQTVFVTGCEEELFPHWKSMTTKKGLEEERRLMYVAVTRAKRNLFLTSSYLRKGQQNMRSRFLDEFEDRI